VERAVEKIVEQTFGVDVGGGGDLVKGHLYIANQQHLYLM
jgi:hypothetical protein